MKIVNLFLALSLSLSLHAQSYAEKLGFPKDAKVVILHVDDVGMSWDSNEGARKSITEGVANSLSIMMPCPWVSEFIPFLKEHPETDAGLHLTLTSEWKHYRWGPLSGKSQVPGLVDKEGALHPNVMKVVLNASPEEVDQEIRSQLDRSLTAGWQPTHLDSHMGTLFAKKEFLEKYLQLGMEKHIPVMFPGGHATLIMQTEAGAILSKPQAQKIGKMLWNAGLPVLDDLHNVSYGFNYPKDAKISDEEIQRDAAKQYMESLDLLQPGLTMVIMHCTDPSEIFEKISSSGPTRKGDMLAMMSPELKDYIQKNKIILTTWREIMNRRQNLSIMEESYGKLSTGEEIKQFTLKNSNGMQVKIINYGGIITDIIVPDKNGKFENVNLNLPDIETYATKNRSFGALIGRFGNRIANGKFSLDGKEYKLFVNNGPNSLHGGKIGFDKKIWAAKRISGEEAKLALSYFSKDMEEGYPGNLEVKVVYTLTNSNELKIEYEAETDKATVINLTNHAYFNLSGDFSKNVLNHELKINAPFYLPVNQHLIPLGNLADVKGTAMDFLGFHTIGERIEANEEQLKLGSGYDHCWVFDKKENGLILAAETYEPTSGRAMKVFTTEPAVQFYSANHLNGTLHSSNGVAMGKRSGLCLETQHFPDSPNQANFPSTVLRPGEKFFSKTVYQFFVK